MDAVRCLTCGDVRWSILRIPRGEPGPCELCGGEMVRERRRPERPHAPLRAERRNVARSVGPTGVARPSA